MPPGKVWLVGAGPGDPGLLTVRGRRVVERCDALVYDALAAPAIVELARAGCERIYVGKRAGVHALPQDEINALLVRLARDGKEVVRLKGGDVFVFGRGGEEAHALSAAGIRFAVVPGITSAIAAPAYAGIPVTHREHNTTLTIATGHEDPTKELPTLDFAKLANPRATTVFLMAMGNLPGIVAQLAANGLDAQTPVAVVRDGTLPTQETVVGTLGSIVEDVRRSGIGAPAVVVVGDVVREREEIRWFDRGPLFGKRVLITRPGAQALLFAESLREAGAEPIVAPTIEIAPPSDPGAAERAAERVRDYDWVVFTSRNGVAAFFALLAAQGRDARAFGDAKLAAIGPKSAAALEGYGVRADFTPAVYVNEALADGLLGRTDPGTRVLLFRAEQARDVLPDTLRAAGRVVDVVAGYRTRFVDDPDLGAKVERADVVTFTSSSTVHGFVYNLPEAARAVARKTVAAIGPITAKTALTLGIRVDAIPDEYTIEGLLQVLGAVSV